MTEITNTGRLNEKRLKKLFKAPKGMRKSVTLDEFIETLEPDYDFHHNATKQSTARRILGYEHRTQFNKIVRGKRYEVMLSDDGKGYDLKRPANSGRKNEKAKESKV